MVSFTTINQGVFLISIMMLGSSVVAAPAAVAGNKTTEAIIIPLHINATEITSFKFPPIISSRAEPVSHPDFIGDLHAEVKSIEKNTKYFKEHGGDFDTITKRDDINSVGGMLVDLPDTGLPPKPKVKAASSNAVVIASSTQVQDLKFYAAVASTAYCTTVVPSNKWTCKNCLKYVPDGKLLVSFTSAKGDINGFVLRSDEQKTIHLVFRGTSSFSNWIVNLNFELTNYPPVKGAKIHTGFLGSYNEVAPSFFFVIQAQLTSYPSYKVAISGHSLGGAQALLAGMDLYQREKRLSADNLSIYTVGSPRVGNPAFAYYVDSTGIPFSRSVHDRDIVPHLPPQSFGYLHPGVEAWDRDDSSKVQICTSSIETNSCSNSIVPFTSISDHSTYYGIPEGECN